MIMILLFNDPIHSERSIQDEGQVSAEQSTRRNMKVVKVIGIVDSVGVVWCGVVSVE